MHCRLYSVLQLHHWRGGSDKEVTKKEDTNRSVEEVSANQSEDITVVNENKDNEIVEKTSKLLTDT